jgi:hypothetical protein
MRELKIAVCLTGQPRMWDKGQRWWDNLFTDYNCSKDVFYHFWNYKTVPKSVELHDNQKEYVSDDEFNQINELYYPKKYCIDKSEFDVPQHVEDLVMQIKSQLPNPYNDQEVTPVVKEVSYQYYSWMKVAELKRQYERENNFEYDICIHGRSDMTFKKLYDNHHIPKLAKLPLPDTNTLYTTNNVIEYPYTKVGDVFWYSNSLTFDIMSDFFRGSKFLVDQMFFEKLSPERALFFYTKMLNITIHQLDGGIIPLVIRDENYINKYGLHDYEAS